MLPSPELHLRAGDWVEVRSKDEILRTLDENGRLENLPFMPQMFAYCGRRFRVFKRAHKTCDTVNKTGGRRMHAAVHLEDIRCDGCAYGGCDAGCLVFWKEAWLKPVEGTRATRRETSLAQPGNGLCSEARVEAATVASVDDKGPVYSCQATELFRATQPLSFWSIGQYWEDLRSRNVRLRELIGPFAFRAYYRVINLGIGIGPILRWLYDGFQKIRGGTVFPVRKGTVPIGQPTPSARLGLQPGELVRIKAFKELLATLDAHNMNRGLRFDAEEVPYCGGTFRVRNRVKRIINEQTGRMMEFKNESVLLEGVYCNARYSDGRLFCPRAILSMWREVWLERAAEHVDGNNRQADVSKVPSPAKANTRT